MSQDDYSYFRRRAAQEEEAALAAVGLEARKRHEELGAAYRLRCRLMEKLPGNADKSSIAGDTMAQLELRPLLQAFRARAIGEESKSAAPPKIPARIEQHA